MSSEYTVSGDSWSTSRAVAVAVTSASDLRTSSNDAVVEAEGHLDPHRGNRDPGHDFAPVGWLA